MSEPQLSKKQQKAISTSLEAVIRIGIVLLIAFLCLAILRPFVIPIAWGAIIAVALYPLFLRLRGWFCEPSGAPSRGSTGKSSTPRPQRSRAAAGMVRKLFLRPAQPRSCGSYLTSWSDQNYPLILLKFYLFKVAQTENKSK